MFAFMSHSKIFQRNHDKEENNKRKPVPSAFSHITTLVQVGETLSYFTTNHCIPIVNHVV